MLQTRTHVSEVPASSGFSKVPRRLQKLVPAAAVDIDSSAINYLSNPLIIDSSLAGSTNLFLLQLELEVGGRQRDHRKCK